MGTPLSFGRIGAAPVVHHGPKKNTLAVVAPSTVANAMPMQQLGADMMELMFNFMQNMMPRMESRSHNEIPINYDPQKGGRLAGVARHLADRPEAAGKAETSPRGPALLGLACTGAKPDLRRLQTVDDIEPVTPARAGCDVGGVGNDVELQCEADAVGKLALKDRNSHDDSPAGGLVAVSPPTPATPPSASPRA